MGRAGNGHDTANAARILSVVRQFVRETHPDAAPDVTLSSHLERDLALDSLSRTELMQRLGNEFQVSLPEEALGQVETPGDVLRFLAHGASPKAAAPRAELPAPVHGWPSGARTLVDVLEWHAKQHPDRTHVLLQDKDGLETPLSYRELLDAARSIAAGLLASGLAPRQTVALMLPTGRDYLASFFGVMLAGGIAVPIYPPARMAQLEDHLKRHARILSNAQASRIITVDQAKPVAIMLQASVGSLEAILTPADLAGPSRQHGTDHPVAPRPRDDDIAFLQYTSGSTGDPKGVMLTHANLLANVRALGAATRVTPDDVFVSWLPLYHDMGLIGAWFGSLYHGIPLVLMSPLSFLARPARWLQAISAHRGTISGAPNFAYELCVRHISDATLSTLDLSCWRIAFNGAEPVNPQTLETFAARFSACGLRREALAPVYGLAENSVGLAFPPPGRGPRIDTIQRKPFERDGRAIPASSPEQDILAIPSCGPPLPGHTIRIVDEAGNALPERRIGRLEFSGPSATAGYYRNPDATATLLREGWLDSGDYAYLAQGEVHITGRVKDLIKRGGRNIFPYDLEDAVGDLRGIRKGGVAVFGCRDAKTGSERLVVMAETPERDTARIAALREAVNGTALDVVGVPPDDIVFVPPHSVLKTSSGKLRRLACREAYEEGKIPGRTTAPALQVLRLRLRALPARLARTARHVAARAYGVYAWAVFLLLLLPVAGLLRLAPDVTKGRQIARAGIRICLRLLGVSFTISGLERLPSSPHILLVNHASYLDGILLTAFLPACPGYAIVAKRELQEQTLSRVILNAIGAVFVERSDPRQVSGELERMVALLRNGANLLVFPEGTFDRQPGLKPFRTGAFLAAAQARVPVATAGLRGTREALPDGRWMPRRTNLSFEIGTVLLPSSQDWRAAMRMRADAWNSIAALSGETALSQSGAIPTALDLDQSI
ncbi:MAG TPA: AMP-binding protein [Noviherbaspirillum sp.]